MTQGFFYRSVSYTHLDVYKRQPLEYAGELYSEEHGRKFTTEKAGFQVAGGMGTQAEDAFHQLGTLCAHQTGNAQDLALFQLKAAMAEGAGMDEGEVVHLHHDLVRGHVLQRGEQVGQLTADPLGDDLLLGHVRHFPLADVPVSYTHLHMRSWQRLRPRQQKPSGSHDEKSFS